MRALILGASLGAALLLIGCGGNAGSPSAAAPSASNPAAGAEPAEEPSPQSEPDVIEETAPAGSAASARDATDVAERWVRAMFADDLSTVTQLSGLPFSWDRRELLETRAVLERKLREAMQDKDHTGVKLGAARIVALGPAEIAGVYSGRDEVETVRAFVEGDDESVLIFVRKSDKLVVGMSD